MKFRQTLVGIMFALLCCLSGGAGAQAVTEFSAGVSNGAALMGITVSLDKNLWFTETNVDRIGRMTVPPLTPSSVVSRKVHGAAGTFDLPLSLSP